MQLRWGDCTAKLLVLVLGNILADICIALGAVSGITISSFAVVSSISAVAGIGNIYSDEILFSCGIRPGRPCCTLTDAEWEKLAAAIPERLEYFIEKNSISFAEYAAGGGKDYRNTPFLQVYGRGGEPCPGCGAPLARIVLGGRSSVFCPHCQK